MRERLWRAYEAQREQIEDFWGRRANRCDLCREEVVWGRRVRLCSNDVQALKALEPCLPLYSQAQSVDRSPFEIQMVVSGDAEVGPPPEALMDHIRYTGQADWLDMGLGNWGHVFVDLAQGQARLVIDRSLVARPDLLAQCAMNTVLTNLFIGDGYAMLHASCLMRGDHALLLMAPHNTGKSTTALRLVLDGYQLLSDSMVFLSPYSANVELLGFSVGRIKVRPDMIAVFAQFADALQMEHVRAEIKYALDLARHDPSLVHRRAAQPRRITLCLLRQSGCAETYWESASPDEVAEATILNSLYHDTPAVWQANLALIARFLERARCFHLAIGSETQGILDGVAQLLDAASRDNG